MISIQYYFNLKTIRTILGAYSVASLLKPSRGDVRYADQQERGYTSSCRNQDIANHYANRNEDRYPKLDTPQIHYCWSM